MGVYLLSPGDSTGRFQFDKEFTSATGLNNSSTTDGNGFASFLLGYPSANSARQSTMTLTTPLDVSANYYGGLRPGRLAGVARASRSTSACASSTRPG